MWRLKAIKLAKKYQKKEGDKLDEQIERSRFVDGKMRSFATHSK